MTTADERIADLEKRLRRVEDQLEIANLIAAYGPLVDNGDPTGTALLWTEDGVYDVDTGTYEGRDGISAMVASRLHQDLISRGCVHLTAPPRIHLHGDTAVAVTQSQLVVRRESGGFDVRRATAHRWELVRTKDGWLIKLRTSRLLDGSDSARKLLMLPTEGS